MNLVRLCLTRPVGVSVGVLLVLLFGTLSLFNLPVQLTPNVDVPVIAVQTTWSGANPPEIEQEIIDRQEELLHSVKGLRKMTSSASDNNGSITLEFYPDIDLNEALRDVNDKLRQVTGYPLEVDEPTVTASNTSIADTIAWLILYTDVGDGSETRKMRDFADDRIKPYLDRVKGVASVDVMGGMEREVQVHVKAGELAARGLTMEQVRIALRRQNANISAGTRTQGKRDFTVRTIGQYGSLQEILDTVVAYTPGGPVYVRDVARVEQDFKKAVSIVRSKGQYVLAFRVRREVGRNVIQVMEGLREAQRRVNIEVLQALNLRLELTQVYDQTVYIQRSMNLVQGNILFGGALAVVVLLLFLRNLRAMFCVALAIPIAIVATFVVFLAMGRSLNVVSLAGIAFAVGMVVDNAVVVLENIFRHHQMGKSAFDAALDGTREVWGAVLASTLTTMAVFLPVIFVREEAGQLFRDISIAAASAVGLSLIVSVTVIPPLAARLLGVYRPARDKPAATSGGPGAWLASLTQRINDAPLVRLVVIVVMAGGSLACARFLVPDKTYLPAGNRNLVFGFLVTPPGYSLDEFDRMARTIEKGLRPYWEAEPDSPEMAALDQKWIETIAARIAAGTIRELNNEKLQGLARDRVRREWLTPPSAIDNFFFVSFDGGCFMGSSSRDPSRVRPLAHLLFTAGERIPGVIPIFKQTSLFSFGSGNETEIQIRGDDLDKVTAAADAMLQVCAREFGFPHASPTNFDLGRPELRIIPDRERAADLGLDVTEVGMIVEACVDGVFVGDYRPPSGDTIDISLYVAGQRDRPLQEIGHVPVYSSVGRIVPLSAVVKLVDTTALEQINHIERQRAVTLVVTPPETMPLESVIRRIKEDIEPRLRKTGQIDPSVIVSLTGNADKLIDARNTMIGEWKGFTLASLVKLASSRFFLSILIVYLLMAALFESWLYPLVIMFSVPLAIFGGLLGLFLANLGTMLTDTQPIQQLDVLTFLGFVILVGLVVNNAILLVHQTLHNLRESGMRPHEAIREAVRVRVRPVLMTSLTTFFGQLPLAFVSGAGSELYRGLASVMLGGLLVATIGTLVLVPSVLGLVLDIRHRVRRTERGSAAPAVASRER